MKRAGMGQVLHPVISPWNLGRRNWGVDGFRLLPFETDSRTRQGAHGHWISESVFKQVRMYATTGEFEVLRPQVG